MSEEKPSLIIKNSAAHALITEENIKQTLKNDKGSEAIFKSFEIKDFTSKGDNYACFVTSIEVTYTLEKETKSVTYVAKLNPCRNMESFEAFTNLMFKKESKFYTDLAPDLNAMLEKMGQPILRVPSCYYTCYEGKKEIICLEDMRAKHFKMFDRKKGLDDAHTILVLEELARLHAASALIAQEKNTTDLIKVYPFLEEIFACKDIPEFRELFKNMMAGSMMTGVDIAKTDKKYEKVAETLLEMAPNCLDILEEQLQSTDQFRVICHGDCWNNNLLFRYDEDGLPVEVCLLDLQVVRNCSIAMDLNYFLFSSLDGSTRQDGLTSFFSCYYASFEKIFTAANKNMTFSPDELYKEYRSKNKFGLMMSVMITPIVLMEAEDIPDFSELKEDKMEEMMSDLRKTILANMGTNPMFRPRFLDMFDEMIEHGVIKV